MKKALMAASSRSVKRVKLFNTLDHTLFCRALGTVSYGGLVIQFAREISPRVNILNLLIMV